MINRYIDFKAKNLGIIFVATIFLSNFNRLNFQRPQYLPYEAEWCLNKEVCISLEVADEAIEIQKGLMFREKLQENEGMLFVLNPPKKVKFWMLNVKHPLDIIFIHKGRIIALEKKIPICSNLPCRKYGPDQNIDRVIELASGEIDRLAIKKGDYIKINFLF